MAAIYVSAPYQIPDATIIGVRTRKLLSPATPAKGGITARAPGMKRLRNIDVAFLPMNLPYTMTPEMVADAAKAFKPKILYPYHYGQTDPNKLADLLKDSKEIEVRIRDMR